MDLLQLNFQKARELTNHSHNILLTMHERMDGDDGGSVLAMYHQLRAMKKTVTCTIKKGVPPSLKFLPGSEHITDDITSDGFDLLIMFGCSTRERCGSEHIINLKIPTINFDHHQDNKLFGTVNVTDAKKSSVAELVYDFFIFNDWEITLNVATCLLTGIITDTGSFMHSNTQSSTLKAAAALMNKGAQTSHIIRHTYHNKTAKTLKAWGQALENSYYDDKHKIIYAVMTQADLANFEKLPQSAFEGFVETLNTFPSAKFAMFLRQDGEVIKGSLRSDPYKNTDVAQIAKLFGGGGHKQAAGFSLVGKLTRDSSGKWKVI